jgi:acid phosphatase type 7
MASAAALLLAAALTVVGSEESSAALAADPVLVAAGDIACSTALRGYNGGEGTATECRQKHTSDLVLSLNPDHVLMLGDGQYSIGSLRQYEASYDPTWGRVKSITHPTPGDHEYRSGSAAGYYTYFDVQPYYSFDIGSWHWISLNSELAYVPIAEQVQWLQQDLASTDKPCIGAFWSTPAFSSSGKGNTTAYRPFWDALYAGHADVVMAGDSHHYERFAKQTPDGSAAGDGIRQFVVGSGGRSLHSFSTVQPNSEARGRVFGVLEMTLGAADYSWQFRTESGGTFTDSGTTACNAKGSTRATMPLTAVPERTR